VDEGNLFEGAQYKGGGPGGKKTSLPDIRKFTDTNRLKSKRQNAGFQ